MKRINQYFKNFFNKIIELLKSGMSPKTLALSIAIGSAIGMVPVLGITTAVCAALALKFKWNMVIIQFVNYIVYPLQLLLIIPFLQIGISFFGIESFQLSLNELIQLFSDDFVSAFQSLWLASLAGIGIWIIASLLYIPLAYKTLEAIFSRVIITKERVSN